MAALVPAERIETRIFLLRGHKVILDSDLAELYKVEVKNIKRQVRRNIDRFPTDFMFELSAQEQRSLRRQIGTIRRGEHSKSQIRKIAKIVSADLGRSYLTNVHRSNVVIIEGRATTMRRFLFA